MHWSSKSEDIRTVEYYRMYIQDEWGKVQTYFGAVLFGAPLNQGSQVVRILPPMPNSRQLYQAIELIHAKPNRERLIFKNWNHSRVIQVLEIFCQQGIPLPNLFVDNIAEVEGMTAFQSACYENACLIPHGETKSYSWLSQKLKKPGSERAVGRSMRVNPFPLFIPCHRVIKKNGNMGGYIGCTELDSWQLRVKKSLLEMEGLHRQPSLFHYQFTSVLYAPV